MYTQCDLERYPTGLTAVRHTAYIPTKFAVENTDIQVFMGEHWLTWHVVKVYKTINHEPIPYWQKVRQHKKRTGDR